ncbi:MAG TPA: RIP metalloprotease RseP [Acidobacteriota bacterium]
MLALLTNTLALIFVLGVMIFVHELGHFATAKFFGIRVDVFALGFGPRLFGFRRGDTDYRVCALPLGGYVKMKGENPDEELSGDDDEFLTRPKWQRFFVLINGPLMNVALSFVLLAVVYARGVEAETWRTDPVTIGWVKAGSPAAQTELAPGDRVLAVDGEPIQSWQEFELRVLISGGQPIDITVANDSGQRVITATPERQPPSDQGYLGVVPPFEPVIGFVLPDSPAMEAGLQPNDRFLEVEGIPIRDWSQLTEIIQERPAQPTQLLIERDGAEQRMSATPGTLPAELGGGMGLGVFRVFEIERRSFGLVGALRQSAREIGRQTALVGEILSRLFTGRMSMRTLSGPIEIARYSGQAASTGDPFVLFWFMGIVSLQLGLLNLLPIPVLDGGHIAVLAFEGLIRRDLSMAVKEKMMTVGVVLLVTLMLVVITFDILKSLAS